MGGGFCRQLPKLQSSPEADVPVQSKAVGIGAEAPDFTLPNATGGETTLRALRGKGCVALVFLRGFQ